MDVVHPIDLVQRRSDASETFESVSSGCYIQFKDVLQLFEYFFSSYEDVFELLNVKTHRPSFDLPLTTVRPVLKVSLGMI